MNYPTGKNSYEYRRDSFYDIVYERGYSVKSGEKYNTVHDSITLICDTHGEFTIIPKRFKRSVKGCYKCGYEYMAELQRKNRDEFIEDCIDVLGNKYDFSEFEPSAINPNKDKKVENMDRFIDNLTEHIEDFLSEWMFHLDGKTLVEKYRESWMKISRETESLKRRTNVPLLFDYLDERLKIKD